jgi:hypothetical protein
LLIKEIWERNNCAFKLTGGLVFIGGDEINWWEIVVEETRENGRKPTKPAC